MSNETYRINKYITVTAVNCSLTGTGGDPTGGSGTGANAEISVSGILSDGTSKLKFYSQYDWAQNWFVFHDASKNTYFDDYIKVDDPSGNDAYIEFTEAPAGHTKNPYPEHGSASSPISTGFTLVSGNGGVLDPTLKISW